MKQDACGVDVCLDVEAINSAPHCPHGPTLLFERYVEKKKDVRRFYACSASRDRKFCNFYQLADDKTKKTMREEDDTLLPYTTEECEKRRKKVKSQHPARRRFCQTCGVFLIAEESCDHPILSHVSNEQLEAPTTLLKPLTNNQTNAQFFFASKSVNFLQSLISKSGAKQVLCIGTPRLYEALRKARSPSSGLRCLLLDMDWRLEQFYDRQDFCRYNMFNHHFFNQSGRDRYLQFLQSVSSLSDLLIIADPPFGGLVEVLAFSLSRIVQDIKDNQAEGVVQDVSGLPPTVWLYPYFMETRIVKTLPSFSMLDYRVKYENDKLSKGKGHESVVRIFTNLNPSSTTLPSNEGYRLCDICQRYVAKQNKHCVKCNTCPTKTGEMYIHCDACGHCVKPSWHHCDICNTCEIPGSHSQDIRLRGCHLCGNMDHKRLNCPLRLTSEVSQRQVETAGQKQRKRQHSPESSAKSSKKKKVKK